MKPRRLIHLLLNGLTILPLLLCLATAGVCIRAQFGSPPYVAWASGPDKYVGISRQEWEKWRVQYDQWARRYWRVAVRADPAAIYVYGRHPIFGYPSNSFQIHLYYWPFIPALAALPAVRLGRNLLRRRIPDNGSVPCPHCGYDLRATPQRCPECGMEVERPKEAMSP